MSFISEWNRDHMVVAAVLLSVLIVSCAPKTASKWTEWSSGGGVEGFPVDYDAGYSLPAGSVTSCVDDSPGCL